MSLAQRLAWLDGISTLAVLATAMAIASPGAADPQTSLWVVVARAAFVAAICIGAFYYNDLYNFEVPHDLSQVFGRLCRALGLSALVLAAIYLVFPEAILGGNLAPYALLVTLLTVLVLRAGVYALAKRAPFSERVVIMGGGRLAAELAQQIGTRPDLAMRLVGVLAPPHEAPAAAPHLGAYGDISDVVRRQRPERIIVAMPDRRGNLPVSALLACRFRGIHVEEGTQAFERFTHRLAVESLTPSALVFGDGFRVSRAQLAAKRVLSVAIALTALLFAAPFMALIAVTIKLESRGPVFFIQERIGLRGRTFRLIKFRTMRPLEKDADGIWQRDNASRVTRFGAVLRRYRLDELPQCLNILRGDMSLVGPRPEMASNVATFSAVIPFYNLRHEVRPGLTGWAQVRAGYSMSTEEVTRKLCYDLYYIKHLSLRFDLRILFDTVKFVLSGKRPG
ncbi:MAG TPA: sugar transferase [Methylomirabilota bacterium]|jgi:exopolysaccharide biosynthesis polyprenyl glycosylphosphotransferase|nr:sugar transferase [Methylomirabilota bacterium]